MPRPIATAWAYKKAAGTTAHSSLILSAQFLFARSQSFLCAFHKRAKSSGKWISAPRPIATAQAYKKAAGATAHSCLILSTLFPFARSQSFLCVFHKRVKSSGKQLPVPRPIASTRAYKKTAGTTAHSCLIPSVQFPFARSQSFLCVFHKRAKSSGKWIPVPRPIATARAYKKAAGAIAHSSLIPSAQFRFA